VREKGWRGERGYGDFVEEVGKWKHCIAMIWLEVEEVEGLFIVFFCRNRCRAMV